ncbi:MULTISPECIES: RidA family protein [unclassified Saccharicrinis]|uniref:RidA family protein n=1 Tax=unclassified Saccharicrinis TaxID=2646859 RepID=UPI003D343F33
MTEKAKEQPIPQGKYLPAVRTNNLIYTSGMTPRQAGKLIYSGQIRASDLADRHKNAIQLATLNALAAAQSCLQKNEKIAKVIQLNVYLNTENQFSAHTKMADFATDILIEELGSNGIGSRVVIGVASLPSNAPVEIALIAKI